MIEPNEQDWDILIRWKSGWEQESKFSTVDFQNFFLPEITNLRVEKGEAVKEAKMVIASKCLESISESIKRIEEQKDSYTKFSGDCVGPHNKEFAVSTFESISLVLVHLRDKIQKLQEGI